MVNAVFRYYWFVRLCHSYMSIVLFGTELDWSTALSNINLAAFTWDAVYSVFLIPVHPWHEEGGWIFFQVVGRHFSCCVWPAFCWVGQMLFGCTVCMQSRWVYHRSWRSVFPVSWLVVSVDGFIHCPCRRRWEILVLGGGNPGHRELWLCVSGKRGLIQSSLPW